MKIKHLVIYLILLITFTNMGFSQISFISHNSNLETQKDKIAYSIQGFENLEITDNFKLEIYKDKQLVDDTCIKEINFDSNTFYKKIICDQNSLDMGDYTLVATIQRKNLEIEKSIIKYSNSDTGKSTINYKQLENETIITIQVESILESYQVEHYIPKEIIKELTLENKNNLIESELEYEILDSDPIIAWNIDESPKTIQYKIKKKVDTSDLENLNVQINSQSQVYTYLSYILYVLILVIIIIIIKPIFSKKNLIQKKKIIK